jgi:hypothetical protein
MLRHLLSLPLLAAFLLAVGPAPSAAEDKKERMIFDYEGQKVAKDVKRIVFIADINPHGGRGNHEFLAAAIYLARTINANYPNAYATVHLVKPPQVSWSKNLQNLDHADAIVVLLNHGGAVLNHGGDGALNPVLEKAMARGAGFMAIHYGVEVNKGKQGEAYLKWMGGYFEPFWSVNPWWTPDFKEIPTHETTRGVKPFSINDEWYYHMRFVEGDKGVTPILSAVAPVKTITDRWDGKKAGSHNGNDAVLEDVKAGKPQVMAWAYERPDKGRGFGFTGLHKHDNLANDNMRTLLLNGVAWVSKLEVPKEGIPSKTLTRDELEKLIDDGKLAITKEGI